MPQSLRRVAIVGAVRTPFCRSGTLYADLTNLEMMTTVLTGLVDRCRLAGVHIDEVVGGAVVTHSRDWNIAREAVIGTRLAPSTPGITLMQACGTSLQAAFGIAAKIACGAIESGIAVGSDTVSDPPLVLKRPFAQALVKGQAAAKSVGGKARLAVTALRPTAMVMESPATGEPRTGLSMGEHCELMAKEWGVTRAEQDQLAVESHQKAAAAYRSGWMDDLIVPCAGVFRDNILRDDSTVEKLATLRTAFDRGPKGTLTAGNSTNFTDGAAAVLLASEAWARERGLPVLAYLTNMHTSANNFMAGDGLLMAPTIAVARMLARTGLKLQEFDFYEIHEAFAAQVLATLKAWENADYCREKLGSAVPLGSIDRAKLNVKGSSLAIGHPFAATGARVVGVLAKLLAEQSGRGLISVCTAGGMGVAAILERPRAAA